MKRERINQSGQMLVLIMIALFTVLFTVLFVIGGSQVYYQNSLYSSDSERAIALAEAGIDKAIASLNIPGSNYNGEPETAFGDGYYSVTITSTSNLNKLIMSTGYIPNKQNPRVKKTVKIIASNGSGISFNYGMQIGAGGLVLLGGGNVSGSIYSNGNIIFGNNTTVTGDVYVAGGTQAISDQQSDCFGSNCIDFIFGKNVSGNNQNYVAQSFTPNIQESSPLNKIMLSLKKVGSPSNLTVRIMLDNNGKPDKNSVLATGTLPAGNIPPGASYSFYDVTFSSSPTLVPNTIYWIMLDPGNPDTSNYWFWQTDSAQGYTGGAAKWSPNWNTGNPTWNSISGDLLFKTYMGGVVTSVIGSNGVTVSGDVHANTITSLNIQKNAYYQTINNSTVHGQSFPGSSDPSPVAFPISDSNITAWKNQATQVGISIGDKAISNCSNSLGPGKIEGNVTFNNMNCTLTIKSPLWITGSIIASSKLDMILDPENGLNPGYIIVDGTISLSNSTTISGTGTAGGFLMLLSTYDSSLGGNNAITAGNNLTADIVYAPLGFVDLQNKAVFLELNGYKVTFHNSATLSYQNGLSNVIFSSGPTGAFSVVKGTYQVN